MKKFKKNDEKILNFIWKNKENWRFFHKKCNFSKTVFDDYLENGKSQEKNKKRNRPYGVVKLPCASFRREKCDFSVNFPGRSKIWTFLGKMLKNVSRVVVKKLI